MLRARMCSKFCIVSLKKLSTKKMASAIAVTDGHGVETHDSMMFHVRNRETVTCLLYAA